MGIPVQAIKQKMTLDGLDPVLFDHPERLSHTQTENHSTNATLGKVATGNRNLLLSDIKNARLHKKKMRIPSPRNIPQPKSGGILSRFIPPSVSQLLSLRSSLKKIKG